MRIDEPKRLVSVRRRRHRQLLKQLKKRSSIREIAACDLTDDEWMHEHHPAVEQIRKSLIDPAEVFEPDGGIHQDQVLIAPPARWEFQIGF